jgi:hypothetical protein
VHRRGGARSSARVAVHGSSGRGGARVWQRKAGEAAARLIKAGAGHGRAEQDGERGAAGRRGRARSIGPKPGSRLGMTGRGPCVSGRSGEGGTARCWAAGGPRAGGRGVEL